MNENQIIFKNFLDDLGYVYKQNFVESYKGYAGLAILFTTRFLLKKPQINFIRNNASIPKKVLDQNRKIKVKPIADTQPIQELANQNFSTLIKFRHIPDIQIIDRLLAKRSNTKEIEKDQNLEVKLAGLSDLTKEGNYFLRRILLNNRSKFYLKFNHLQYSDKPEVYVWILYKPSILHRTINLNILLAYLGHAKVVPLKTVDIYDEHIFYYYSDLVDADLQAKAKGNGMYSDQKSKVVAESLVWKGFGDYITTAARKRFGLRRWEKVITNK